MTLYKSASNKTVAYKRFAINNTTGLELAAPHAELDELVAAGILTKNAEVIEAVITPKALVIPPVDSPVKPTA